MPYLENLTGLDEVGMKFEVNVGLKKYGQALTELAKGGEPYMERAIKFV
jgi:hypothetical protein